MKCNIDCPYSKYNGKNRDGTQDIICHRRHWFMDSSKECIEGYTEEHMEQLKKVCSTPPKERFRVFTDIENREEVIVDLDEIPTEGYNVVKLSLQEACDVLNNFEIENEQLKQQYKSIEKDLTVIMLLLLDDDIKSKLNEREIEAFERISKFKIE